MALQVGLHGNAIQAIGSILKAKGVGGLYAGLAPALVRIIPTAVVQVRRSCEGDGMQACDIDVCSGSAPWAL